MRSRLRAHRVRTLLAVLDEKAGWGNASLDPEGTFTKGNQGTEDSAILVLNKQLRFALLVGSLEGRVPLQTLRGYDDCDTDRDCNSRVRPLLR
jgi:hypothetical protein